MLTNAHCQTPTLLCNAGPFVSKLTPTVGVHVTKKRGI
jgi:hypothetical protein